MLRILMLILVLQSVSEMVGGGRDITDGLTVLDWILRLSNLIGLFVLFSVARKIGAAESVQSQSVTQLKTISADLKELSREVYEMIGANRRLPGGPL